MSDTPLTDRRCAESQKLKHFSTRFAWMCDHSRRLERDNITLRAEVERLREEKATLLDRLNESVSSQNAEAVRLQQRTEAADADTARLDWIEREKADFFETHGKWFIAFGQPAKTEAETLRAAIDAARAQGGAK